MIVELLVLARNGKVSHFQRPPASWGRKEGPPAFEVVLADIPPAIDPVGLQWDFHQAALLDEEGAPIAYEPTPKDYRAKNIIERLLEEVFA